MTGSRRALRHEIVSIALVLALVTFARSSLADHYYVPTGSMEYTLMPGDRVVVDKTAYGLRVPLTTVDILGSATPDRGDVVVFDSPVDGLRLIKRVVAVEGDLVHVRDGRLSINGQLLAATRPDQRIIEIFGDHEAWLNLDAGGGPEVDGFTVPTGELLVMGDHRGDSHDGRYFGTIPEREIVGRAIAVYYRRGDGLSWIPL